MKEFKDKVAVVTGAASGIGRCLAERGVQEGMKVVVADIDKKALAQTEKDLKGAGAPVLAVETDVSKAGDIEALAKKTLDTFGAVHLLCNNAGVYVPTTTWESTLADWQWVIGVNLWGAIYGALVFVPIMLKQDTECHIVNTASIGGLYALPYNAPYNVSKFGVVTLSETLYHELALIGAKLKVSVLCPGNVNTGILDCERHRPPELRNDPAEEMRGQTSPHFEQTKDIIRATTQAGTAPQQIADMVFDAIKEEKFYIIPHPEGKAIVQDRMERILQGRNPENILKLMGIVR